MHGQELEAVNKAKYLGLTISKKLSWSDHIAANTKKEENTRAFLVINIRQCMQEVNKQCYTTLVRTILKYASDVWNPHQANNIYSLAASKEYKGEQHTSSQAITTAKPA